MKDFYPNLKSWLQLAAALLCLAPAGLGAKDSADAWAEFNHLKDDSDAYVGEGIAKLSEYGGDADKALVAARQRARADLVESIRVHVSSVTKESLTSDGKGVTEELSSKTEQGSDLAVENVKMREFRDLPAEGKVTVLAYVSKADYRRQLAGKSVPLYVPENGLRISAGWLGGEHWTGGNDTPIPSIELYWHGLNAGVTMNSSRVTVKTGSGAAGGSDSVLFRLWDLSLGYDLTPWHWKVQPFVPLRLGYELVNAAPFAGSLYGASAGVGLRYWPTDAVALDLGWRYGMGFNKITVTNESGKPLVANKSGSPLLEADMTGQELVLGLLWSGF